MLVFKDAPNIIVNGSIVVWYLCQVVLGFMKFCQRQNQRRHGFVNFAITNRYIRTAKNVSLPVTHGELSRAKMYYPCHVYVFHGFNF